MNFILYRTQADMPSWHETYAQALANAMGKQFRIETQAIDDLENYCATENVDMLFISCKNAKRIVQRYLNACRQLRLPYVFLTDDMQQKTKIERIVMPVTLLEEEVYKAEIAVHIARYTQANVTLLQAKDYGSKAQRNTQKISTLFEKFDINPAVQIAKKDSFHLHKEVADRYSYFRPDLTILTASREYGLDDIFFGPAERYTIIHNLAPVMLLNPRGDLFALCD